MGGVTELVVKMSCLLIVLAAVLGGNLCFIRYVKRQRDLDKSLKRMLVCLTASGLVSDAFNLVNLLVSTGAGGWPLGLPACEVVGFVSTTLSSSATWMVTLATLERYFKLMVRSEHTSTFSARNIHIMVVGFYTLDLMLAAGPFYGFGDYSFLRGHLKITVTANTTSDGYRDYASLDQLFSLFQRASITNPEFDIMSGVQRQLQSEYHVIIKRVVWSANKLTFYIRVMSQSSLDQLMSDFNNGTLLSSVTKIPCLTIYSVLLHENNTAIYTQISTEDAMAYRNVYIPVQELGYCTTDLTSPNRHSVVWTACFVTMTFVIPFFILLTSLCIIYFRYAASPNHVTTEASSETEVQTTNILCTSSVLNCGFCLFYYVVILAHVDGVYVSPNVVFACSFLFHCRSLLTTALFVLNSDCMPRCGCSSQPCLRLCGFYSKDGLSYEMSEFDVSRTISGESSTSSRVVKSYMATVSLESPPHYQL